MIVLGLDPGFAKCGWSIMEIYGKPFRVLAMGTLKTEKSKAKKNVMATDDNFRRAREVAEHLNNLCQGFRVGLDEEWDRVSMICMESMSHMRNASSMAKVALAYGVVAAMAEVNEIPCVQASPQKIKKVCGWVVPKDDPAWKKMSETQRKKFSKKAIQDELERRYPETVGLSGGIVEGLREHAFDSIGAIEACRESEVFRALLMGARRSNV
jgi:Holliday junction resolvasome RuvABC endonuclease subunit